MLCLGTRILNRQPNRIEMFEVPLSRSGAGVGVGMLGGEGVLGIPLLEDKNVSNFIVSTIPYLCHLAHFLVYFIKCYFRFFN